MKRRRVADGADSSDDDGGDAEPGSSAGTHTFKLTLTCNESMVGVATVEVDDLRPLDGRMDEATGQGGGAQAQADRGHHAVHRGSPT